MNVAETVGECIAPACVVVVLAVVVVGVIDWLAERHERARLAELERRTEKLAADTRALVNEQRQADDETSALLIEHFAAQARARRGVYDQCEDDLERRHGPVDMGWAMRAGMYGFEVWEARMAREVAEEQSRHLLGAGDEARRLDRLMNWSPERQWGPEGLR